MPLLCLKLPETSSCLEVFRF